MKKYNLNPAYLNKWIKQNGGSIIDMLDGSLLDDYLIECKRGAAVIREHYINPNLSGYTVIFSRNCSEIYNLWEDLKNRYTEQFGPTE